MNTATQSPKARTLLLALISVLQENNKQASMAQIYVLLPHKLGHDLLQGDQDQIREILKSYSSDVLANEAGDDAIIRIFQDLGDDTYELIADDETIAALQGDADSYVDPNLVPPADLDDHQQQAKAVREQEKNNGAAINTSSDAISASTYADPSMTSTAKAHTQADIAPAPDYSKEDQPSMSAPAHTCTKAEWKAAKHAQKAQHKEDKADMKCAKKIDKAERAIQSKERKIEDHENQIERDHSTLFKSIHEAEIRHDKKVIDKKESKIERLESEIENR